MLTRKIRRNLQDYGFLRTLEKLFSTFLYPLYYNRIYRLYRANLNQIDIPTKQDSELVFRRLQADDHQLFDQIIGMEEWLSPQLKTNLDSDGLCLVALDDDTVAGFNLINYGRIHLPTVNYRRNLRENAAFSEQITVNRAYRGKGLGTQMRLEVFRILSEQGFRYLYGGTDIENTANLALCSKVGLTEIADVHFQKVLWKHKTTVRRVGRR